MSPNPAPDAAYRRARVLVVLSSLLLVLEGALVLNSGSVSVTVRIPASASRTQQGASTGGLQAADWDLSLDTLRCRSVEEAAAAGRAWARLAAEDGQITDRELAAVLPSPAFILARTSPDDYIDDIRVSASGAGAFARAYQSIRDAMPGSNAAGARMEAALRAIYAVRVSLRRPAGGTGDREAVIDPGGFETTISSGLSAGPVSLHAPIARGQSWIASPEDLKKTHRYALDIFFVGQDERGRAEKGPAIRSMSPGIVVAAADDWVGGEGAAKYRRGGLTPRAGNGAVIYDPEADRYYTYFHMYDVFVRPGQWVDAGEVLGRGGNTGTNARKRGHGGHLHLEIYAAGEDRPLDCWELRDLMLSH